MPNARESYPGGPALPPGPAKRRDRRGKPVLAGLVVTALVGCSVVAASFMHRAQGGAIKAAPLSLQRTRHAPALGGAGGLVTPSASAGHRVASRLPATSGGRTGSSGGSGRAASSGSALFGGDLPLVSQQGKLHRRLAIVRLYDHIGEQFGGRTVKRILGSGSTVLVSLDTKRRIASYASIAAGHKDSVISRFLRQVNQAAVTYHLRAIYICFQHEVDNAKHHAGLGTPAQFIQAWDRVHRLAARAHLDWNQGGRLHWVWLLEHGAYFDSTASHYWPGGNEVDIVGVDGYNTGRCRFSRPGSDYVQPGTQMQAPSYLFDPALRFAQAHGNKPVIIAEWASTPYTSPRIQPDYIRLMQAFVASHRQIRAALYWDSHAQHSGCNYNIDRRPASMTALAAMGHSPALQGSESAR